MKVKPTIAAWLDRASLRANGGLYRRLQTLTPIAASSGETPYLFHTWDREMGPHVWREGGYDATEMAWILDFLGHPQKGKTVVDVGANIGTSTIPFLTTYGARRVIAFEPEPRNLKLLRCNLILHDLDEAVDVHPVAVSSARSTLRMELCSWNGGDHRIAAVNSDDTADWDNEDRESVVIEAVRLDEVDLPSDVALFWVDTQGHEASVLAGAPRLPVPWVIEYWPYVLRRADSLELLHGILSEQFRDIVDVRASMTSGAPVHVAAENLDQVAASLGDRYTDFILFPNAA